MERANRSSFQKINVSPALMYSSAAVSSGDYAERQNFFSENLFTPYRF